MNLIKTFIVDSFTNQPFKGNPAGVCLLVNTLEDSEMLSIAQELGLSETAFIKKLDKENHYSIRFFSPKMEIPLCGHATLASSKVLLSIFDSLDEIFFTTHNGLELLCAKSENDEIKMRFPIYDTIAATCAPETSTALGISEIVNCTYNKENNILILEIEDCVELRNLNPNFEKLLQSNNSINGVVVTAASTKENYDFESRYFWPWSGTNEDPVTGATHTFLAKYWSKKLGKTIMNSFQCSERGGFMEVALLDDKNMTIKSNAVIILEGHLIV
jgi:PhzF family phenazine biosynthesis protein